MEFTIRGLLFQSHQESQAERKRKKLEENDFYDSDEDEFLDRTGERGRWAWGVHELSEVWLRPSTPHQFMPCGWPPPKRPPAKQAACGRLLGYPTLLQARSRRSDASAWRSWEKRRRRRRSPSTSWRPSSTSAKVDSMIRQKLNG
jgi:hypothetical protein